MAEHYYTKNPTSEKRYGEFYAILRGLRFKFTTVSGVFSFKKIDRGTCSLINYMRVTKGNILDLGCGYGPVGVVYAKISPESTVYMVDINKRAIEVAKKNAKINKVQNAIVRDSDGYSAINDKMFDNILLNPPQCAGKDLCIRMIKESYEHLNKGGVFQLVARHNKGGNSFMAVLDETFKKVEVLAKDGGYWVYLAVK